MEEALLVLLKTITLFLIIVVGWFARKRALLTGESSSTLSKFVVDVAFPALVLTQLIQTVDAESIRISWFYPLLGIGVLGVGQIVGLAMSRFFTTSRDRATFIFLVAVTNWVYLPLPIIQGLYGAEGVTAVLLFNVGAQAFLWTVGVWTLRSGASLRETLLQLFTNPGLIATALGVALGVWMPGLKELYGAAQLDTAFGWRLTGSLLEAIEMLGSLTIPLSLVVTGAQLGGLKASEHRPSRAFNGVLLGRLILTPLVTLAIVRMAIAFGLTMPELPRMTVYIIACMPVAVSCSILTDRYYQDTSLAARAIFYSTFLSIITMPTFVFFIRLFDL